MTMLRVIGFVALASLVAGSAGAEDRAPWTTVIKPAAMTLRSGECTAVRLDLTGASGADVPRNARGAAISIADFDMTVAAEPRGAVVGRYDGERAWSACACPAAAGAMATITATYPGLASRYKHRCKFQSWPEAAVLCPSAVKRSGRRPSASLARDLRGSQLRQPRAAHRGPSSCSPRRVRSRSAGAKPSQSTCGMPLARMCREHQPVRACYLETST